MSDGAIPIKKAIRIIVVTWILSLVTTLALVYIVPNIFRPTWHEVARFSGTFQEFEDEDTDRFYISSDRWRIYWIVKSDYNSSADAPPKDVEFRLFLYSKSNPRPSETYGSVYLTVAWLKLADFGGSVGQGEEWFYKQDGTEYITGSGEFYLLLLGARLEWEIIVEAYH